MEEEEGTPKDFICAISQELMQDPVILVETGHSFERRSIETWLRRKKTDPLTGVHLKNTSLVSNFALKGAIEDYLKEKKMTQESLKNREMEVASLESIIRLQAEEFQQIPQVDVPRGNPVVKERDVRRSSIRDQSRTSTAWLWDRKGKKVSLQEGCRKAKCTTWFGWHQVQTTDPLLVAEQFDLFLKHIDGFVIVGVAPQNVILEGSWLGEKFEGAGYCVWSGKIHLNIRNQKQTYSDCVASTQGDIIRVERSENSLEFFKNGKRIKAVPCAKEAELWPTVGLGGGWVGNSVRLV